MPVCFRDGSGELSLEESEAQHHGAMNAEGILALAELVRTCFVQRRDPCCKALSGLACSVMREE